ncbi:MAG: hypothetical protein EGQ26_04610 [Clostridiales bacterium]|nr:hypothetical protein [Clostridiales bacterium]
MVSEKQGAKKMRKIAGRIMCVLLAAVLMAGLIPTVYVPKCVFPLFHQVKFCDRITSDRTGGMGNTKCGK